MQGNKPALLVNEILDVYMRENFQKLKDYFQTQNQLLDFEFFEVNITDATKNKKVRHNLKFTPTDIFLTGAYGSNGTINVGLFDQSNMDISAEGPVRLRFFAGKYWNSKAVEIKKEDVLSFGSTSESSAESNAFKVPTMTILTTAESGEYVPPKGCKYLRVIARGPGGGGAGSGTSATAGTGGIGNPTIFGNLIRCNTGGPGQRYSIAAVGGYGGTYEITTPAYGTGQIGNYGSVFASPTILQYSIGGAGGGGTASVYSSTNGNSGVPNSGNGGSGAGSGAVAAETGQGGGQGGSVDVIIPKLEKSYAWTVGKGGVAGLAGTNGFAGGAGADGIIIITEYYQ